MNYLRLLILSLLATAHASAQIKTEPRCYAWDVGLDLTKLLPITQESGVTLETFVYGPIKRDFRWRATVGFADLNFGTIYSNLYYLTKGYYGKVGISKQFSNHWELGVNTVYSSYDEVGKVNFAGPIYGNLSFNPKQHQSLWGLELQGDYFIEIYKHWWLNIQGRLSTILSTVMDDYFSPYYAPGFGNLQIGNEFSSEKERANRITIDLSIRAVYRFY